MIAALLYAARGGNYHDALRKRPWLRFLALDDPGIAAYLVGSALLAALLLWATVPAEPLSILVEEDGPIERPTAWLYLLAALAAWFLRNPADDLATTRAVSGMLLLFGAREMDLHKAWQGTSALRASFFTGDAPLDVKLVALLVVLLALRWTWFLLLRHGVGAVLGARRAEPVATSIVVFVGTLVLATVLDRSASILGERFDVHLSFSVEVLLRTLEEIAELAMPVVALLALWQRRYLQGESTPAAAWK